MSAQLKTVVLIKEAIKRALWGWLSIWSVSISGLDFSLRMDCCVNLLFLFWEMRAIQCHKLPRNRILDAVSCYSFSNGVDTAVSKSQTCGLLTCGSSRITGVINSINDGCIPFRWDSSRVMVIDLKKEASLCHSGRLWCQLHWMGMG